MDQIPEDELKAAERALAGDTEDLTRGAAAQLERKKYREEHGKLVAGSFDRASTAIMALGIFTPLLAAYQNSMSPSYTAGAGMFICGLTAYLLHYRSRIILMKGFGQWKL